MIKTAFAAAAAATAFAAPAAFAGPYVNVEANSGWTGSDYSGTNTDSKAQLRTKYYLVTTKQSHVVPSGDHLVMSSHCLE